ncbi:Increased rDNA silencing protein [Linnemannia schmuckeri]|uniref:Increased rDNA silencing protein n=1 Tax=Linnemannia schmuckeri TaxID=64567 RepID=A0A9P5S5U3_9FUNG|nr:Increased rDNA silencing protein [Linnemannia schmuckeri]
MVQVLQAKAIFDCNGDEESELTFLEGDILTDVRETSEDGWLHGRLERTGEEGLFPDNYVELIRVETSVQPQLPPQLPSRTSAASKATGITPVVEASKPQLPARQTQPSGTRPVPPIDAPVNTTNRIGPIAGGTKVGLPGLGSHSMYGTLRDGGTLSPDTQGSDLDKVQPGPPALPKRSNTVHEGSPIQEKVATPGAGLSARDRMAALSMSSQAARSPLSAVPRPTLPPRTSTASSVDSILSPAASKTDTERKHTYQVPDAAVPVPKLTTFSRPRSARTSKASSPVEQKTATPVPPAVVKQIASERQAMSTPPKLPSRNAGQSIPSPGSNDSSGPVRFSPVATRAVLADLPTLPAINRNSQPLPLPSRSALNSTVNISSVTMNNVGGLSRSATTGAVRSAGAAHLAHQDAGNQNGPLGSAFGVKLNSVGPRPTAATAAAEPNLPSAQSAPTIAARPVASAQDDFRPPPLPARSNTIPTSPSVFTPAVTLQKSPMAKLQRDAGQRPFSSPIDDVAARQDDISAQIQQDHQVAKAVAGHDVKTWNQPASSSSILKDALTWHENHTGIKHPPMGTRAAAIPPTRLPDINTTERVGISRDARRRYEELFRFVCKGEYLEGAKVHAIYVRSRLDSPTLAQIWDLVDIDNAGRLNKAQFCMGLYLIDERLGTGLIPLEVSDELWVSIMQ